MKRSRFTNLFSLFVACALIALPATLGCGGGDADLDGDMATEEMGDDYDPETDADAGVLEPADSAPVDGEPADDESVEDSDEN